MKQNSKKSSHSIFVAFHISEDVKASGEAVRILTAVSDIFGDQAEKTAEVATMESREIVAKIRRPVMNSESDERDFFVKLLTLFRETSDHTPHFTHVSH